MNNDRQEEIGVTGIAIQHFTRERELSKEFLHLNYKTPTMHTTEHLPPPKNDQAQILFDLIHNNEISEQQYSMNGFRSRLTDLRKAGVPIQDRFITKENARGNKVTFKVRYLFSLDLERVAEIYLKINQA